MTWLEKWRDRYGSILAMADESREKLHRTKLRPEKQKNDCRQTPTSMPMHLSR
jgi:hypothetical protein